MLAESLLTNNRFRPILFAIVILIFSVNHYKIREAEKQNSWIIRYDRVTKNVFSQIQKYFATRLC